MPFKIYSRVAMYDHMPQGDALRGFIALSPDAQDLRLEPAPWPSPDENLRTLRADVSSLRGDRSARGFVAWLALWYDNMHSHAVGVEDDEQAAQMLREAANGPVPRDVLPPDDDLPVARRAKGDRG
jgi:hypothetical protein